jgi:hypothetical protein
MRIMSRATLVVIWVALMLGFAGCGATGPERTAAPVGHRTAATGLDRRDRRTASGGLPPVQARPNDDFDDEPHASGLQVSVARSVASAFFTTYVAFLYGRLPASRVTGVDRTLRRELENGHARTTPAERLSRPSISHLSLSPAGPPVSVVAIAVLTTACCTPSHLTATLEPRDRSWLVVAVTE